MTAKLSWGLYCGVALCALLVPGVALANDFTIVNGQTVTATQTLNTTGDVGKVDLGGTINVSVGDGIDTLADGVTVNNAGAVTGIIDGIYALGAASSITNSGTAIGSASYGIYAYSNSNSIVNSGTANGGDTGIYARGGSNTITNSGTATGGLNGIVALDNSNTITNSGTATGSNAYGSGIYVIGDANRIINSGTANGGSYGIISQGSSNSISNSGTANGGTYGIYAYGDANSISNSGTANGGTYGIVFVQNNSNSIIGNRIINSGMANGSDFGIVTYGNTTSISNSGTANGGTFGIFVSGLTNNITNSGTANGGVYGIYANGTSNSISNSGTVIGSVASIMLSGTNDTLNLFAGSNIQGNLYLGSGNFLNIGPGLNTSLAYTGTLNLNTFGAPYVDTGSVVTVIDPTGFAAQSAMLTELTGGITNTVDGRLASARTEGAPVSTTMNGTTIAAASDVPAGPNTVMWATGLGNDRNQKSAGADAGFNTALGGVTLGFDGEVANRTRAGGFIGAALSNFATDGGSQKITTNSYFGGLYAGFTEPSHFLNLAVTAGSSNQSSDRTVNNNLVVGGIEHATANYGGFFISPSATLGTDIHRDGGILTPSVRARYAGMFLGGYAESGSAADLTVASSNVNVFDLRAQLAFAPTPIIIAGGTSSAVIRVGADGTFTSGNTINASLLGQSLSFNAGNNATTVRGFVGFDMSYATMSGSKFFLETEAGYDTSNAFTGEAKVGLEVPL